MASLQSPFKPCARETISRGRAPRTQLRPLLNKRDDQTMAKRTLWAVYRIESALSTDATFDALWGIIGVSGQRYLSVTQRRHRAVWALIFKADQAVLTLRELPNSLRVEAAYEIAKPGAGQAASRAISNFAKSWFAGAAKHTSNFKLEEIDEATEDVNDAYEKIRNLSEDEYWKLISVLKLKETTGALTRHEKIILRTQRPMAKRRDLELKKMQGAEPFIRFYKDMQVPGTECDLDKVVLPLMNQDCTGSSEWFVPGILQHKGITFDHTKRQYVWESLLDTMLQNKNVFFIGPPGIGKGNLSKSYGRFFLEMNHEGIHEKDRSEVYSLNFRKLNDMKGARSWFKKGVVAIFEDTNPMDKSQSSCAVTRTTDDLRNLFAMMHESSSVASNHRHTPIPAGVLKILDGNYTPEQLLLPRAITHRRSSGKRRKQGETLPFVVEGEGYKSVQPDDARDSIYRRFVLFDFRKFKTILSEAAMKLFRSGSSDSTDARKAIFLANMKAKQEVQRAPSCCKVDNLQGDESYAPRGDAAPITPPVICTKSPFMENGVKRRRMDCNWPSCYVCPPDLKELRGM